MKCLWVIFSSASAPDSSQSQPGNIGLNFFQTKLCKCFNPTSATNKPHYRQLLRQGEAVHVVLCYSTKGPISPRSFLNLEPIFMSAIETFKMIPFLFVDALAFLAKCNLSGLYVFICCRDCFLSAFVFGLFVIWDAWDGWDGSWESTSVFFVLDFLFSIRLCEEFVQAYTSNIVPSSPSVPFSFSFSDFTVATDCRISLSFFDFFRSKIILDDTVISGEV